jgi:hypothetical protein
LEPLASVCRILSMAHFLAELKLEFGSENQPQQDLLAA